MFGVNDRTSLTGINVFNKNKKLSGYVLKFPFNGEELDIPEDMVQMTIFENDSGYANFGHAVFKICIGEITTLDEINNNSKLERIEFFPSVFDELEGTADKIFYFIDDTGKKVLFSKVNDEDIVVSDIKEAKRVLTKISNEYRTINEATTRLKNCGVGREVLDVEMSEDQKKNALGYYLAMIKLKDIQRTGWLDWKVQRQRIESVPDHVFGTQQLAIALCSELGLKDYINLDRVLAMLAVHETEEPVIGDIPLVSDLKPFKKEMGNIAVQSITDMLTDKDYNRGLVDEFNKQETLEAIFAKIVCDKPECDIMSGYYDEDSVIDLKNQKGNKNAEEELVEELLGEGKSFSGMWMEFGRRVYKYPISIDALSRYAEEQDLHAMQEEVINEAKKKVKVYLDTVKNMK